MLAAPRPSTSQTSLDWSVILFWVIYFAAYFECGLWFFGR